MLALDSSLAMAKANHVRSVRAAITNEALLDEASRYDDPPLGSVGSHTLFSTLSSFDFGRALLESRSSGLGGLVVGEEERFQDLLRIVTVDDSAWEVVKGG